jgi:transcriptional regulator with XRE-family HTH domain
MSKELSEFLRREIKARGLSERALSRAAGLNDTSVHYILNNPTSKPTVETCVGLAEALDLPQPVLLRLAGYEGVGTSGALETEVEALALYLNQLPGLIRAHALEACWAVVRLIIHLKPEIGQE